MAEMTLAEKMDKAGEELKAAGWHTILLASRYQPEALFLSKVALRDDAYPDRCFDNADRSLTRMMRMHETFSEDDRIVVGDILACEPLTEVFREMEADGWNLFAHLQKGMSSKFHLVLQPCKASEVDLRHAYCDLKRDLWKAWSNYVHDDKLVFETK